MILEPFYKTGVRCEASVMRAHPPPADGLQGVDASSRLPMDRKEIAVLSVGKDDATEEQSSSLSGWG